MGKLTIGHVSPINYAGFREDIFGRMESEIDRMFNEFLSPKSIQRVKGDNYPKADVFQLDKHLVFEIVVPYCCKEDLEVSIDKNTLTVSGKASLNYRENSPQVFQTEIRRSSFSRSWALEKELSEKDLSVDLQAGVLRIKINDYFNEPKVEEPKKKIIPIK